MKKITYKEAGVDIAAASAFKAKIKPLVRKTFRPEVLTDIGGFGSLFSFRKDKFKDPVLVSSSDGVGTKLKIAMIANKHDTIGIDAVAMNVNDILCTGAEPLFFLDYIAYSQLKEGVLVDIIKGLSAGCQDSGCALIGGETAQMPGMYKPGEYDVAGFCVGVAERRGLINGAQIAPGNIVIGLESSGLHSNGYSLVRKALSAAELKRMHEELLKPTRIYVKPVLSLLRTYREAIKGISNITGGAFYDKISRILPEDTGVLIQKSSWSVPKIFKLIQNKGGISDREMYHTLNMGIGMVMMVDERVAQPVMNKLAELKIKSWAIGKVIKGDKTVEIV